jgi:hypothetical protein
MEEERRVRRWFRRVKSGAGAKATTSIIPVKGTLRCTTAVTMALVMLEMMTAPRKNCRHYYVKVILVS